MLSRDSFANSEWGRANVAVLLLRRAVAAVATPVLLPRLPYAFERLFRTPKTHPGITRCSPGFQRGWRQHYPHPVATTAQCFRETTSPELECTPAIATVLQLMNAVAPTALLTILRNTVNKFETHANFSIYSFRNPLTRSKSIRRDSNSKSRPNGKPSFEQPPKTAPLSSDWPGSSDMLFKKGKDKRGKSAERAVASESEEHLPIPHDRKHTKDKDKHSFVTGSKNVMSKAKSGGGNLFNRLGKIGRSSSNTEKEIPDSEYEVKVIISPLTEAVSALPFVF